MKTFEVNFFEEKVCVKPKLELYTVKDFNGTSLNGLAIQLNTQDEFGNFNVPFAMLTVSFGEFIGLKNTAYIDTNNCPFAEQLLEQGFAKDTGFTQQSGFCTYPLWVFDENFLKEMGAENYKVYSEKYDKYMNMEEPDERIDIQYEEEER